MDDHNVGPQSTSNPVEDGSSAFDKDVHLDPIIDLPAKEKPVETSSSGFHDVGDMMHPLFVNCLLDKIRRMEERVNEVIANRDLMKADNLKLKEKVDSSDKHLLRLKNHKNKLIRRVLKLHNENDKNEEKVRELNAQVVLMQFKGQSSAVNIQVFNAPVKL